MPRIHVTLSGHEIRYDDPGPELEHFLQRAQRLAENPEVTEGELVALVYSRENPILDHSIFPGRGTVTREVLDRPEYAVLQDLLFRKEVQQRAIDVRAIEARYTLTPGEVAERLGVHVSAVTKACQERRVSSWVKGRRYFLDPGALAPLEQGKRRGPAPGGGPRLVAEPGRFDVKGRPTTLSYRAGQEAGAVLRVRLPGPAGEAVEPSSKAAPAEGQVKAWRRVGVLHGRAGKLRFFELEPASEDGEVKLGALYVRGRFRVVEKVNNAKAAREAWEAFQPV